MRNLLLATVLMFAAHAYGQLSSENNTQRQINPRNPALAFLGAMTVPGLGHMYSYQSGAGIGIYLSTSILLTAPLWLGALESGAQSSVVSTIGTIAQFTGLIVYVVQLIDAPFAAERFNERNGFEIAGLKVKLGVEVGGIPVTPGHRVNNR